MPSLAFDILLFPPPCTLPHLALTKTWWFQVLGPPSFCVELVAIREALLTSTIVALQPPPCGTSLSWNPTSLQDRLTRPACSLRSLTNFPARAGWCHLPTNKKRIPLALHTCWPQPLTVVLPFLTSNKDKTSCGDGPLRRQRLLLHCVDTRAPSSFWSGLHPWSEICRVYLITVPHHLIVHLHLCPAAR